MHSLRSSLNKRLYTFRLKSAACARQWQDQYWQDEAGIQTISCRSCPKFSAGDAVECTVPFGSPIRKCVSAAQEANLHSLRDQDLLEIGFGKHSIARRLVKDAGGTWTGIEPTLKKSETASLGKGGYGHVAKIPFPDETFDIVVGIQSLEHLEERLPNSQRTTDYATALKEIHRVLKSNGSIYFDAPIYLHGHEMFIVGDMQRIRKLFDSKYWRNVTIQRWRDRYSPLDRYPTPTDDYRTWDHSVSSYSRELLDDIRDNQSVALVTIKASKKSS